MKRIWKDVTIAALLIANIMMGYTVVKSQNTDNVEQKENSTKNEKDDQAAGRDPKKIPLYTFPSFYRGIYLTTDTACSPAKFKRIFDAAKSSNINVLGMDVQTGSPRERMVPAEHVKMCLDNGIHPVARVVVFPGGLASYPCPDAYIENILDIAENAASVGFKEIQFDYIRFSDEGRHRESLRTVSLKTRYEFIENFFKRARTRLESYGVRIAADVFGRIPHNNDDAIGQKLEVLDPLIDVISPMAYPSHYNRPSYNNNPYATVKETSSLTLNRMKNAQVVPYIQAFKMKQPVDMSFIEYIKQEIKAVHDVNAHGFFLWNARQDYVEPLRAVKEFYSEKR